MKFGFYYSPDADLTNRFNSNLNEEGKDENKWEIEDIPKYKLEDLEDQDKFWWNKRLYQQMELCDISEDPWKIKMIRGHVGQEEIFIGSSALMAVTLISRKATLMGGIIDTGIDDDGSVANFVETEQCIEIDNYFISFVMVRGSVPWFWDRVNNKQNDLTQFFEIELLREFAMHEAAFKIHIKDLIEKYHKVVLINLLDTNNSYEHSLIKFYEFLLKNNKSTFKECLKYQYINYKKESVQEDIEKNTGLKIWGEAMKFLWISKEGKVKSTQKWVLRFNSLNCLHRTNNCQEKVSTIILKKIINKLHDEYIIDETKIRWRTLIPKIEGLYRANAAKICIESGCHCIINKQNEDDGYLQVMYGQITSLEKYFTNFISSIQEKEDNLYQEALGN